jgi:HlyD family secretion protein
VPAVKPATAKPATADIQALLGTDQPARWWARPSLWIGLAVLAAAAGGIYFWQAQKESNAAPVYVTEALRKGNLTLTVAANGTIVPTRVVSIGSELSGTVKRVLVDVNDVVKKGQVLVELDTAKLDDQVLRSRAALASAQAQLAQTNATWKEARAGLARFGKCPPVGRQGALGDRARRRPRHAWRAGGRQASLQRHRGRGRARCPPMRPTCPRRPSARRSTAWC